MIRIVLGVAVIAVPFLGGLAKLLYDVETRPFAYFMLTVLGVTGVFVLGSWLIASGVDKREGRR